MKKKILFVLLLVNSSLCFAFKIESGDSVIISEMINEDLYITGGNVIINAPVHGDLIIAGGDVIINDSVTGDIIAAGGKIRINGLVADDIRCAGGDIEIYKNVGGDLVVAGGTVILYRGNSIGGMLGSGGNITLDGVVNGKVKITAGHFSFNGRIAGDLDCKGGDIMLNGTVEGTSVIAGDIVALGDKAAFYGDVRYWNKAGFIDFNNTLINSKAGFDPSLQGEKGRWYFLGASTIFTAAWYLGMVLLMLFLIQYLFPFAMKAAAGKVAANMLKSFGTGLLFFVAVPVFAAIAVITLVGVPVGLLLLAGYVILIALSTVITALIIANWLNNHRTDPWGKRGLLWAGFGIFCLIKILGSIPFVGWIVMVILICISYGGLVQLVRWRKKIPAQ